MKDQLSEAKAAVEASLREHNELSERLQREYEEKDFNLKESLRAQIHKLVQEQIKELQDMKTKFDDAKALIDQKNRDLKQQFSDIQFLY